VSDSVLEGVEPYEADTMSAPLFTRAIERIVSGAGSATDAGGSALPAAEAEVVLGVAAEAAFRFAAGATTVLGGDAMVLDAEGGEAEVAAVAAKALAASRESRANFTTIGSVPPGATTPFIIRIAS
jgi:hypothetical protein